MGNLAFAKRDKNAEKNADKNAWRRKFAFEYKNRLTHRSPSGLRCRRCFGLSDCLLKEAR